MPSLAVDYLFHHHTKFSWSTGMCRTNTFTFFIYLFFYMDKISAEFLDEENNFLVSCARRYNWNVPLYILR